MSSDDGQQHQWRVVPDTFGTKRQKLHSYNLTGAVAY